MEAYNVLPESINQKEAVEILSRLDPNHSYSVDKKVYYPYQFIAYHMKIKTLLLKEGNLGCTIDLISNRESMIDDKPTFVKKTIDDSELLHPVYSAIKAEETAMQFFRRHVSKKYKFLTIPTYTLTDSERFYRPYWVVSSPNSRFIVDGVSGKYHPL
ncbi:hypothetical protein [Aquibacillus sediminis]|uniref:hypothetical protein n=1 Tax=Aquibacillus sediminis TaxID=2574734 RepID=UPI001109ACF4|nr:hypothetical protein [Aquibacillus sediminis]